MKNAKEIGTFGKTSLRKNGKNPSSTVLIILPEISGYFKAVDHSRSS